MEIIRRLLKERGMKQRELSEILGCSESTMSQYISGKRNPDFETLLKIAEEFGVSVDYLLREEKQPLTDDEELWEIRQALHDRPELKVMFDLTKNASPAQVKKMLAMMKLLGDDENVD